MKTGGHRLLILRSLVNLMGVVAQNEREKIRERQRQGIEQAKIRGVYQGRQKKYAPNSKDREGRLIFNDIREDYIKRNYKSKAALARKYGISRQQLYRIIKEINRTRY